MASYFDGGFDGSFVADTDLTTHQFKLAKAASIVGNAGLADSGSNPYPIGVLQNDPSAGQEARIRMIGFTKAIARVTTCVLDHGAWLKGASDGLFEPLTSITGTETAIGRWFGPGNTTVDASIMGNVLVFITNASAGQSAS